MSNSLQTTKKRPISCKCECGEKFTPTKHGQAFVNSEHRLAYWKRIQSSAALEDYQWFLKHREKFLRYLKYESRINAWLKANKK